MGFKRNVWRFFPTEVLMKAPATYPIGLGLRHLKKWTQTWFEREGSGLGQVRGSPGWGASFVPAPSPGSDGSTPFCLPLGARDGLGPWFRVPAPRPSSSLIIQDGGGHYGRHLINIHEGRGLPPAGAPGRILKSSRGHWGSWEPGPQCVPERIRAGPLFPAGKA